MQIVWVQGDTSNEKWIQDVLREAFGSSVIVTRCSGSGDLMGVLERYRPDVVMLEAQAAGQELEETIAAVFALPVAPPVVVFGDGDEVLRGELAIRLGAQDFVPLNELDARHLRRAVVFAMERGELRRQLRAQAMYDALTGLMNRHGFIHFSEQQRRLADRSGHSLFLIYLDLDGLKKLNDSQGHEAGDLALLDIARALRNTFRRSDLIARLGGDEFATLTTSSARTSTDVFDARLASSIAEVNKTREMPISAGWGVVEVVGDEELTNALRRADELMYQQKRTRRAG